MDAPTYSPMSLIPNELLAEIFNFTLPQSLSDEYLSPISLCLICTTWRDTVMDSPSLWTVLKFSAKQLRSSAAAGVTNQRALKTWLGRSGELPLSSGNSLRTLELCGAPLGLVFYEDLDTSTVSGLPFECNLHNNYRSTIIDLSIDNLHTSPQALAIFTANPLLRKCHFTSTWAYSQSKTLPSRAVVDHLHTLSLQGDCLTNFLESFEAPVLKSLTIAQDKGSEIGLPGALQSFLHHSNCSLEELILENVSFTPEEFACIFKVTNDLNSLIIRCRSNSIIPVLSSPSAEGPSTLPCPHLRHLQLVLDPERPHDALSRFLATRTANTIYSLDHLEQAEFVVRGSMTDSEVEELRGLGGERSTFQRYEGTALFALRW